MRKIILLIWLLGAAVNLQAQRIRTVVDNPIIVPVLSDFDKQLQFVNQSTVTSGIIYERSMRTTNLFAYNQPGNSHNTADSSFFSQTLAELYQASNNLKLISCAELKNRTAFNEDVKNEVNIGIINSSLQVMNFDVSNPSNGGLTFDGTYFRQITGKIPFYDLQALVIAPLKNTVKGSTITYKFDNSLILNNGPFTIKTMVADFGDGVSRNIITNSELVANNIILNNTKSNETQIIAFKVTFNNNITITTFSKIFVSKNDVVENTARMNTSPPIENIINIPQIPFESLYVGDENYQGLEESFAIKGKIEPRVFYATNGHNNKLRKPIIIIDGFDPGDNRKITDKDCENDDKCKEKYYKTENVTRYFFGIPFTFPRKVYDPSKHKSILETMVYGPNNDSLVKTLRSKGYDVVIVNQPNYSLVHPTIPTKQVRVYDWHSPFDYINNNHLGCISHLETRVNYLEIDGGADYIQRNALTLTTLIKDLNARLRANGSNEKMVIIGPSMGGQISRYALAYMEKKEEAATTQIEKDKWNHNTRLWVAFDSPNHGANVPYGDQALINILSDGGANIEAQKNYDKLNSVAGKQQLIELHKQAGNIRDVNLDFLNGGTTAQGMPSNTGNPFFKDHYSNQFNNGLTTSKGFPMNLRKLAITNGSLSGKKSVGTDGELMLDDRLFTQACVKPFSFIGIGGGPSACYTTRLAVAQASLQPSTGNRIEIASFNKFMSTNQFTFVSNLNTRGNLDIVPGGLIDATAVIHDAITGSSVSTNGSFWQDFWANVTYFYVNSFGNGAQWENRKLIPNQCFIPTFSALAITNPNQNWGNPLSDNLTIETCVNDTKTPFNSYFGEDENTNHISLNEKSVNWLLKELGDDNTLPIEQAPHMSLAHLNLTASKEVICLDDTDTVSINTVDLCKMPSAFTWSVSNNLQILSTTSNNRSVVVKAISSGPGFIQITFTNGQKIVREIFAGVPTFKILNRDQHGYNPSEPSLLAAPYQGGGEGNQVEVSGCNQGSFDVDFYNQKAKVLQYEWESLTTTLSNTWSGLSTSPRKSINFQCNQEFNFRVRARNACGWSEWVDLTYYFDRCTTNLECAPPAVSSASSDNFTFYPVPVNNRVLNIAVRQDAPWFTTVDGTEPNGGLNTNVGISGIGTIYNPIVNIEIHGFNGIEQQVNNVTLPYSLNLLDTICCNNQYFVKIIYNNQEETRQIIVE